MTNEANRGEGQGDEVDLTRMGTPPGTVEMDGLDRHIMRLLRPDARRSYASIARAIGVSEPTVRNRVTGS